MTRKFIDKVIFLGSVDTRKYRYRACGIEGREMIGIYRLPLELLDTTAARTSWEVVTYVTTY